MKSYANSKQCIDLYFMSFVDKLIVFKKVRHKKRQLKAAFFIL